MSVHNPGLTTPVQIPRTQVKVDLVAQTSTIPQKHTGRYSRGDKKLQRLKDSQSAWLMQQPREASHTRCKDEDWCPKAVLWTPHKHHSTCISLHTDTNKNTHIPSLSLHTMCNHTNTHKQKNWTKEQLGTKSLYYIRYCGESLYSYLLLHIAKKKKSWQICPV